MLLKCSSSVSLILFFILTNYCIIIMYLCICTRLGIGCSYVGVGQWGQCP